MNKEFLLLVESDRYIVGNSQRIRNSGIDAFELWCWRRLLKVPWTARRSNLKEINQYSLGGLKLHAEAEIPIFWPPYAKNQLIQKDPDAGNEMVI